MDEKSVGIPKWRDDIAGQQEAVWTGERKLEDWRRATSCSERTA